MYEIKLSSDAWYAPTSCVLPTLNLTAAEQRRLEERGRIIDAAVAEFKGEYTHVKINSGIYKGSICRVRIHNDASWSVYCVEEDYSKNFKPSEIYSWVYDKDRTKQWVFANRRLSAHIDALDKPIKFKDGTIYPEFFGREIENTASLLIGYEGDPVFQLDTKKRSATFTDRLGQEVKADDLVVVALNYGAGLEVCMVKGYADADRVIIESIESGELDRIPLEKNATRKIMRMPYSLKDTALMLKLSR